MSPTSRSRSPSPSQSTAWTADAVPVMPARLAGGALDALALVDDDRPALVVLLEVGVAGDQDHAVGCLADAAADVDGLAVLVLELDRGGEGAFGAAPEEEDLAGPGAGDEVEVAVAVEVHQLGTEADASARGDAAVLAAVLELDARGELRAAALVPSLR